MKPEHPSLISSLKALPRPAWVLFFGMFLNKFGGFVVPFLTVYLTSRGFGAAGAGLAISAFGLGNLAAAILGGYLADGLGRRKTIVLSMFSGAACMMLLSTARSLPAIVVWTFLTGVTGEMYRPAASALLADLIPPGQRVIAFSVFRMSFNAGWAFGPATAGFLAGHGFIWLFAGDAATSVLFGVVALFALPLGLRASGASAGWAEAMRTIRTDRRFHRVLLAGLLIALMIFQTLSTFGLYVTHQGFSTKAYGLLLSMNGALVVLCELQICNFTRRFPARTVMAMGHVVAGLGFGLMAFAHTLPQLIACMVILTVGEMTAMPVLGAYISELAPPHMRGRYTGTNTLVWSIGLMIGPAMGMRVLERDPAMLWLACALAGLLAALVIRYDGETAASPYWVASVK